MAEPSWPAVDWSAHFTDCNPRACTHPLDLPDWWLGMSGRGIPMAPSRDEALRAGIRRVHAFKGYPPLPEKQATFVRELVADSLTAAPQPVTHAWVRHTLAGVATFVRWAAREAIPLDRDILLERGTIDRWVHQGLKDQKANTRATYQARVEIIACHHHGIEWLGRKNFRIDRDDPGMPLTVQDEADLWLWARNLPRATWRGRAGGMLALGVGCGLTRYEMNRVAREDVTRDGRGVHVAVSNIREGRPRVVTCRSAWETRLAELTLAVPSGHLVASPWRTVPQTDPAFDQMFARVHRAHQPPVRWNHQRMRNTWLVRLIEAGVPLNVIMDGAGVTSVQTVERLLPLVRVYDEDATAAWLRGGGP